MSEVPNTKTEDGQNDADTNTTANESTDPGPVPGEDSGAGTEAEQ